MSNIVIIGAGVMGVLTAHQIRRAGADVTLWVRPARLAQTPPSYRLYSYDDGSLHELSGHRVIAHPDALAGAEPSFVIITLDGHALASDDGRALLRAIGDTVRASDAVVVVGSIGAGTRELAVTASGLPEHRVVSGMLAMIGHATRGVSLPLHAPTDAARLAQADFAFRHLNEGGFLLEDRNPEASARFVALYDRGGLARCFVAPPEAFAMMTRDIFPVFIAAELAGWPRAEQLIADTKLWSLAVEAVRAIRGLAEHGETGRQAAATLTADGLATLWRGLEQAALPLDFAAFNAYHHGHKLKEADLMLLQQLIARGKGEGRDMGAVAELLSRLAARP